MGKALLITVTLAVAVGAAVVLVTADDDEPVPRGWELVGKSPSTATKVQISINSGWCHPPQGVLDRVEVDESSTTVVITPFVAPGPESDHACLSYIPRSVDLASPLGDRRLVQGSISSG